MSSAIVAASREHLVMSAIRVIERGGEPTMRAVAAEAGVAERTIYRYFETREQLAEALTPVLRTRAGTPLPATAVELEDYAERLMRTFAANANLTRALLTTKWMREHFLHSRKRNFDALGALLENAFPRVPAAERAVATSALRAALSGSTWLYLDDAGLDPEAIVTQARWTVRTVLGELRRKNRRR